MSLFANALIWFGAAVSIAEIMTGALLAPLGVTTGLFAIIAGHAIGGVLLFGAGFIGAKTNKTAMQTVAISFGGRGANIFSVFNLLQLVGWSAVMLFAARQAANSIMLLGGVDWSWSIIIGLLLASWVLMDLKWLTRVRTVAMLLLFFTMVIIFVIIFSSTDYYPAEGLLSFGAGVELSVAMVLSWTPLISDYTSQVKQSKPLTTTLVTVLAYIITSIFMFTIGLTATLALGQSDIAQITLGACLGVMGLLIIVFSTVATTFIDVHSSGESLAKIFSKVNKKIVSLLVCVVGTLLAIFTVASEFENFLYLIGSVFAPMGAILLTDYFILKKDNSRSSFNLPNLAIWLLGFIVYRVFMNIDTFIGSTLPVMLIIAVVCVLANFCKRGISRSK